MAKAVSFEFFPPSDEAAALRLFRDGDRESSVHRRDAQLGDLLVLAEQQELRPCLRFAIVAENAALNLHSFRLVALHRAGGVNIPLASPQRQQGLPLLALRAGEEALYSVARFFSRYLRPTSTRKSPVSASRPRIMRYRMRDRLVIVMWMRL